MVVGPGETNPMRSRLYHQEETTFLRHSQGSGDSVVNSVCRHSAEGLCQFGV